MSSQLLQSLIEPPLQCCNVSDSISKVIESPVKPLKPHLSKIVASPTRLYSTRKQSSNIIEAPASQLLHNSSPKRKRPRLSNLPRIPIKRRIVDKHYPSSHLKLSSHNLNIDNFDDERSDYNRIDNIDWNISNKQVLASLMNIVPDYWEALQDVPWGIIHISTRLYVIQEWNSRSSSLIVSFLLQTSTNIFRNINIDMSLR